MKKNCHYLEAKDLTILRLFAKKGQLGPKIAYFSPLVTQLTFRQKVKNQTNYWKQNFKGKGLSNHTMLCITHYYYKLLDMYRDIVPEIIDSGPIAVFICTLILKYGFRRLFQNRKKIEFKINWIFCLVRTRYFFFQLLAQGRIFSCLITHFMYFVMTFCNYPNLVKWISKLGFSCPKIKFETNLIFILV